MLSTIRSRNLSNENEEKFIQERIMGFERNAAELSHVFADYTRKAASLRDKGDDISKAALAFSDSETINKTLSDETENFANCMSAISDYGDSRINSINKKVIDELKEYGIICKRAKVGVRSIYSVRQKEIARKKNLDRLRDGNPGNRHLVLQAETEMVKASAELARTAHNLEEEILTFERQKIHDFKTILLDFIAVEMGYHARVIEVLTKAYNHVANINEDSDVQEFKQSVLLPETTPHEVTMKGRRPTVRQSQSLGSLSRISSGKQISERPSRNSPGITRHNIGIPKPSQERRPGINKARSQDELGNEPKAKRDYDYDSDTVSETATSEQQSVKSEHVSPFLAKHFSK